MLIMKLEKLKFPSPWSDCILHLLTYYIPEDQIIFQNYS